MEELKDTTSVYNTQVFILDKEETELLHINYKFAKVIDGELVQFNFKECLPLVGTDYYIVGTCLKNYKINTIVSTKENIIAALSTTKEPLLNTSSKGNTDEYSIAANDVTLDNLKATTGSHLPTKGALSPYLKAFLS